MDWFPNCFTGMFLLLNSSNNVRGKELWKSVETRKKSGFFSLHQNNTHTANYFNILNRCFKQASLLKRNNLFRGEKIEIEKNVIYLKFV